MPGVQPLLLDLRHYETVLAIVELGTMTEAANRLATTQSALSHRLAEAERRLGTPLFNRGPNRRLMPTRAGLVIHQAASRALADLGHSEATVLAEERPLTATVRIAVGSYDCYHWFPDFVTRAAAAHPEIGLELVVVGDSPGAALAAGHADLVLAPGRPEGNVALSPLVDDELMLMTAPDHRLAGRTMIDAEELASEAYLTYNARPAPGFEYDRFIRPANAYPRRVTIVRTTSAITELVAAGTGVSILSRWALTPAIESGRIVPIRCGGDGLSLTWSGVVRASEPDDGPPRLLMALLADHLAATATRQPW